MRTARRDRLITESERIELSRAEVLDQRVCLLEQSPQHVPALSPAQIQEQAPLPPVHIQPAEGIYRPIRGVHFDDVGAGLSERPAAGRAGQHDAQVEDPQARDRRRGSARAADAPGRLLPAQYPDWGTDTNDRRIGRPVRALDYP